MLSTAATIVFAASLHSQEPRLLQVRYSVWAASGEFETAALGFRFQSQRGRLYRLQESEDLKQWENTDHVASGNGGLCEIVVPTLKDRQFFRITYELDDHFLSEITGIEYPIHVYEPPGLDETEVLPIIYATDGQWITSSFSSMIEEKGIRAILVTIEQGPGDRRAIDYLLPGAIDYFAFLKTELIPTVESIYSIDTENRSLCGTSYGGLFVGLSLLMDDVEAPLFRNYLSFDGSFYTHRSETYALEQARFEASQTMKARLILSSATRYPNNHIAVGRFQSRLQEREYEGLEIVRLSYPVVHNDVADPSFDEALDILFPDP
ncbi:alpha/beta hydrolase-fold protein [Pelagicoccus sp. SDUM812003]|uniref:alpha/beta hydrolase n=1 Tax=Pelagicoccus sp. SDUM812003 TaxID=3041267 RepID=UPI00280D3F4D|nr:alpha/beta hydrolase-fold protein [Pelagicoccus sp. SDUM812003]MDQ8204775.1 alpha/beta hydrolase-fold protein [Pelagicoccus sp. SDUM812003]